jgi:DNA-directed RNA polymerase specialized sigma24 family protein
MFSVELRECLGRCDKYDARLFAMHYINGLTYDEIGQREGISRQRAHQRAERVRLRIIEEVAA